MYCETVQTLTKNYKIFDHRKKTGILSQVASYFERKGIDIAVWAKTVSTKEILNKYEKIKNNFLNDFSHHNDLMLFDYPCSIDELKEIINKVKPSKIHLMNYSIDENIENYIKQTIGMVKYCTNHLEGNFDVARLAQNLGMSEYFTQLELEILENIGSINILNVNKVQYIKPFNYSEFKEDSLFEVLKEEFIKILEFKKSLLECNVKEFEQILDM
jgi:hypothetical protein